MNALAQILAVTAMNLRSLPQRLGSSLVVVVGMAAVVAVVTSVLSMSTGYLSAVEKTGSPDRALVLSSGSEFLGASSLPRDNAATIADGPGVKTGDDAKPIASSEFYAPVLLTKKADGLDGFVWVMGAGPDGFALDPEINLVSGRRFKPAVHELIVGKLAQSQYKGLDVGDKVSLPSGDWTIVGSFESNGDAHESDLVGDAETLLSAYRRNTFNDVAVRLRSPGAFDQFKSALTTNPTLQVDVVRETDYYAKAAKPFSDFLKIVAYFVGGIMAVGAIFGALNTMYSAVSSRTREIATLRAVGFGAGPVVISVIAEALLLAVVGALVGATLAWLFFNGDAVVSGTTVYALTVTPALFGLGVVLGVAVGVLGGLFPAIRAARLPVAAALRAS